MATSKENSAKEQGAVIDSTATPAEEKLRKKKHTLAVISVLITASVLVTALVIAFFFSNARKQEDSASVSVTDRLADKTETDGASAQ